MLPSGFFWRRSGKDVGLLYNEKEIAHATIANDDGIWRLWFTVRLNIPNYRFFGSVFAAAAYAEAWILKWEREIRAMDAHRCHELVSERLLIPRSMA